MGKKGPPKFFENKPKAPSKIPMPSSRTRRSGAGEAVGSKRARLVAAGQGKKANLLSRLFAEGESWKTYLVIVVSVVLLVGLMFMYIGRSFEALDQEKAVAQLGLLAATFQTIDDDPAGFKLAESMKNDSAILTLLQNVDLGGAVTRNDKGVITGSSKPEEGTQPLFMEPIPGESVVGKPFHFILAEPDAKSDLPTVEVAGVGKLHPPDRAGERWVFDGDLTHVHRSPEAGGDVVSITVKKGNGETLQLSLIKPRESPEETPGAGS